MRKFSRKTQGVISVFLILILVPTMVFSALLVDGSRMVSARTITQEAADLAALSVLSDYNVKLKENFGLFALNDSGKVEDLFQESLKATLQISGLDDPTYSEQVWEILKKALGGSGSPFADKTFMNLYDFKMDEVSVTPLYSLANPEVLQNQIVEYSKYRGLYILGERMGFLDQIGEITKFAQEQDETAEVMKSKIDIDEKNMEATKKLQEVRDLIQELNEQLEGMQGQKEAYFQSLNGKMEELAGSGGGGGYSQGKEDARKYYEKLDELAGKLKEALPGTKSETQAAIGRLDSFIQAPGGSAENEAVQQMVKEAGLNRDVYQGCLEDLAALESNPVFQKIIEHRPGEQIAGAVSQIDTAIHKYAGEREPQYDENGEEIEDPYKFYYYDLGSNTESIGSAKGDYSSAWDEALGLEYSDQVSLVRSDSFYESKDESKSTQLKEMAKNQSGSEREEGKAGSDLQEIDSAVFDKLPSKAFDPAKEAAEYASLLEEDSGQSGSSGEAAHYGEDVSQELNIKSYENGNEKASLEASKDILDSGKCSGFLNGLVGLAEGARDEVLTLTYIFGTFKTRMTGNENFKKGKISEDKLDKFYIPKWRFEHEEGELDIRFSPKSKRTTQLNAEIEYLIYGMSSDLKNESAVYASIFAPRLASNMIALYTDGGVKNACQGAAVAASAATLGTIPEPVFFWIFLTAWATAETVMDMQYLIDKGYKIPLFKTKDNLILDVGNFGTSTAEDGLVGNYEFSPGIYVCYEDYLLFFLLLCGSNKRLMRTADLIEMDMKKSDGDFQMEGAYTFIRAKSNLSIRYLFANTPVFSEEYESAGLTGRLKFKNIIYQGY